MLCYICMYMKFLHFLKKKKHHKTLQKGFFVVTGAGLIVGGGLIIWAATLPLPTIDDFNDRVVKQTTKIYDRTGEHLLFDVFENIRRTVVPLNEMSPHVRNATIAIEDDNFYNHHGVEPTAFIRAMIHNLRVGRFDQGGSTLTQQVIKNSVLTPEKTITRKIKEWILAVKLEAVKNKDEILEIYLNEVPYGGSLYGIEAAAQAYFDTGAKDLTIAEAAYLAALPKAPTYYSPYGSHRDDLDRRQHSVIQAMRDNNFITEEEYNQAKNEVVVFEPNSGVNIQAAHFVMYVRDYISENYDDDLLETGGLKVITTLDVEMQEKAQDIVHSYAIQNDEKFNAENAGMVVIEPQTGQILVMVGSRDYFDNSIDGNFNVTTARRQPGSSFKPFAYAEAFKKGYTPDTILFDLKTQFSTACAPSDLSHASPCYSPVNYDDKFQGPLSMRDALAQSVNVPAIKALYLAGLRDTFNFAREMGLENLTNPEQYGLTLVLGGGEVSLLNITSAYGVFANEGIRNPHTPILRIEDGKGNVLDEFKQEEIRVLDTEIARQVTDVLSDNTARTPAFGANSPLHFPGYDVAAKTGTTNDYKDAWIVGYTPNFSVGTWAGNNDNTSMDKRVAGFIVAPMWNDFMDYLLENNDRSFFTNPRPEDDGVILKPILRGEWQGGVSHKIDTTTGKQATEYTPEEVLGEIRTGGVHSILHWVNKNDPRGPIPNNPSQDSQYTLWEYPVLKWVESQNIQTADLSDIPEDKDDVHKPENLPAISFTNPERGDKFSINDRIRLEIENSNEVFPLKEVTYFLNTYQLGTVKKEPFSFTFTPSSLDINVNTDENVTLTAVVKDEVSNESATTVRIEFTESQ